MKVGVIGTGNMGKSHVRNYSELKEIEDVYVFDIDREKTKRLKEYGVIVCDSIEEILNKVDAVSICVPTKYHFDIAKMAIEKDIHCLIEKPITLNVREGEEIINLLENKDLIVGVGHIERFNPIVDEIVKIVDDPLYIEIRRHNPGSARIKDSTIVEDLMIHDIDIIFNVLCMNRKYELYSVWNDYLCDVLIKLDSSIVLLSASKKASKKIRTIYIEEEEFTIEGDFMNQEIYIYKKPERYGLENERYVQENIIEKVLVNKVEPLKEELKCFIKCVKKGEDFPIAPIQALKNLRICEEIRS
ncbi:Gfo/Idh/MocA family oxidoreductase [candidate division WOR-3 bacterium]|nr:Gfo/Idh/MocA family oxidoreductase [candidate division WOR-3 bacterium]